LRAPSLPPQLKGDLAETLTISYTATISLLPPRDLHRRVHPDSSLQQSFFLAMAASHPHLFQPSVMDENEIHKLVANHFLLDRAVLQWHPVVGEDIPTPNTNEIVVFSSFFQRRFNLSACDFFRGLLDLYKIELIHLNPNCILQIAIFVHLCKAFLGIPHNFLLFKNYFS
jgi:hypothetical protein